MVMAICFNCGSAKSGVLIACKSCGVAPLTALTDSESAVSLALSDYLSSEAQLTQYSSELHNGLKLSVPPEVLTLAQEMLKNPQFRTMLPAPPAAPKTACQPPLNPPSTPQRETSVPPPSEPEHCLTSTELHKNPFAILGVTTRDDRKMIVKQADEKSLEIDHDVCQKARADLTNPRTRLTAEVAWLPGVSPKKISQLLESLLRDPMAIREESDLPVLADCNLTAALFETINASDSAEDVADLIQELASLVDSIDLDEVVQDINNDREVSGFPEIRDDQVENEIAERKRYFKSAIRDALNRLPPTSLLDAMTFAVDGATCNGENHAPELIDDLVDTYEVEVQSVLEKEAENIEKLIQAVRNSVKSGEGAIKPLIDKIEKVVRNWNRFVQPIQLSAKARGITHKHSGKLAHSIRSLAIDLFNEHDMLDLSHRLSILLQELFAKLPEMAERIKQDIDMLSEIRTKRTQEKEQAKKQKAAWAQAISFSADVGLIFKDTLRISADGVVWKDNRYPLDAITAVRWGSVRNSVNGISTRTDYTIAFLAHNNSTVISLSEESTFSGFTNALWRAVGVRLMIEMSEALKEEQALHFGDMLVEDNGVTLIKHSGLFGSDEKVRLPWNKVHVWSANGEFVIGSKSNEKIYGSASYIDHWNTHLLDHMVRAGFKKGISRLSDYFSGQ
jgi:hypothetical protein